MKDIFNGIVGWFLLVFGIPIGLYLLLDIIGVEDAEAWTSYIFFGGLILYVLVNHFEEEGKKKEQERRKWSSETNDFESSSYISSSQYPENWNELRKQALSRDGYKCGNCGRVTDLRVHHIVPISRGGTHRLSNLRTLCNGCHKKLHPHMV